MQIKDRWPIVEEIKIDKLNKINTIGQAERANDGQYQMNALLIKKRKQGKKNKNSEIEN